MTESLFKTCTTCFQNWHTVTDVLEDPALEIIGYQVSFRELESGFFLFNHSCYNTLSIPVNDFRHLRNGPIFTENKAGKEGCPEYCLQMQELGPCYNNCECQWVRDVIQVIKSWKKTK